MLIFRLYVTANVISVAFAIVTIILLIYSSVKRDRLLTLNNGTVSSQSSSLVSSTQQTSTSTSIPVVQVPVQVPVRNLQVPVPVQVLCINYRHSVTLRLHKVKVVVSYIFKQDAELSQRDRAARCVIVFAKSRRLELGDNILRT